LIQPGLCKHFTTKAHSSKWFFSRRHINIETAAVWPAGKQASRDGNLSGQLCTPQAKQPWLYAARSNFFNHVLIQGWLAFYMWRRLIDMQLLHNDWVASGFKRTLFEYIGYSTCPVV